MKLGIGIDDPGLGIEINGVWENWLLILGWGMMGETLSRVTKAAMRRLRSR